MKKLLSKGFTLVELLIVITIIGILATIGFVAFGGTGGKARDAKRKGDIDQISKAYEVNYDGSIYIPLADTHFTSGKTPTPPSTGDYTCVKGPGGTLSCTTTSTATFTVCAKLEGGTAGCSASSATCYCLSAAQGPAAAAAPTTCSKFKAGTATTQTCANSLLISGTKWIKCSEITVANFDCSINTCTIVQSINYYTDATGAVVANANVATLPSPAGTCAVTNVTLNVIP